MKKGGIVVLSLFDGMSCGRIALERAGIKVKKYYASEIDKYAQIVSAANYPDIIRLGDITKWKTWKIEKPDLIIGGSPCQGFSFAGKGLNFNDPRSKLFFTFADIVKHYKPKYFLLENVKMKKEHQKVISDCIGVEPIEINSALVSAQNRRRLYWTNIQGITQPNDKGILLKDIIEEQAFLNDHGKVKKQTEKSNYIDANYHKGKDNHGQRTLILCGRIVGRNPENPKSRKSGLPTAQMLECRRDEKTGALSTVQKDNLILVGHAEEIKGYDCNKRVYSPEGKAPTLAAASSGNLAPKIAIKLLDRSAHSNMRINKNIKSLHEKANCIGTHAGHPTQCGTTCVINGVTWRKLTPLECERLQTVPDNFTAHVSNTQRYKMLGNGWTVDVIAHIFRGLK
jgi:DNA-cytosine methyltransferase